MRRLLAALLLTGCASTSQRLDTLMTDLHERGLFDGAVVVSTSDRVMWAKGYGFASAEANARFTPDTPADGASLAKTMTAALVLELQREGKLSLDDAVQQYLPELPYPGITIRHLLSHSSGLVDDYGWFDPHLAPDAARTTEVLLGVVANVRPALKFEPGSAFEYNSFAYDLAALAAARAAGASYGDLVASRFFRPLGMTTAFLRPARFSEFPAPRTRGYRRSGGKLEPNEVFDFEAFHGGSNIYFSTRDLARWGSRVPEAKALERATIAGQPSGLTLGSWYRTDAPGTWWYSGHLNGFHDELFRDGATTIAYMSNNTIEPWMQKGLTRAIAGILGGGRTARLESPAVDAIAKGDYDSLTGTWGALSIARRENRLVMTKNGVTYAMHQIDPRFFYVPGLDFIIGFGGGRMYLSSNVEERWITRGP